MFNASLMWAPTENTRVTFSYLQSLDATKTNSSATTKPINNAIVEVAGLLRRPHRRMYGPSTRPDLLLGLPTRRRLPASGRDLRAVPEPGLDDFLATNHLSPSKTHLWVPSLTLEYNAEKCSVKSITAYVHDESRGEASATWN